MMMRHTILPAVCLAMCLTSSLLLGDEADTAPASFDIGLIGLHGGIYEHLEKHAPSLHLRLRYFEDGEIASKTADLGDVRVLYVQHTRSEDREAYQELFARAKRRNPSLKIIVFQPSSAELFRQLGVGSLLTDDADAGQYYGSSSENLRRLLVYTAVKYLGRGTKIEPPEDVERQGLYHPDHEELFPDAKSFLAWQTARGKFKKDQPRLLVTVHSTHLFFQQPRVVDALVREAERQGALAVAIIDGRSETYLNEAIAFHPNAVIHTCHSSDTLPFRLELGVPHLHSIFFRKQSIAEWQESVVGLASHEIAFHIIGQELLGAIEPQVGAGTKLGSGSSEAFTPVPDRIEHLVGRALAHAELARTPLNKKKVAIIYYDREMGKGELMRGSATGMHLNAPRSLLAVLGKMKRHGYRVDPLPRHEDEMLRWMIERGRQVGVWAPAELDRLARHGSPVLVPVDEYEKWYEKHVPADRRKQVEKRWGPPPGRFMVWKDAEKQYIVIPRVDLGNVILLPQPLRGEVHGKEGLNEQAHDKTTTPPHNYLATYFWLQEGFKASAVVHFGTHGSEFFLPGKPNGLSRRCWPDIIMGTMPNFNPWIIENMVESSPVRRRVYGVLIDHLSPPIVNAGLSDELANLNDMVEKWETLEAGALRERFVAEITKQTQACRLDVDLKLTIPEDKKLPPEAIERVAKYLHDIQDETTPISLHVLGQPPRKDLLPAYMVNILRKPFLDALAKLLPEPQSKKKDNRHEVRGQAERVLQMVLLGNTPPKDAVEVVVGKQMDALPEEIERGLKLAVQLNTDFAKTTDEIDNLLKGLDGRFVTPGPGNNPIRNPSAVPTGRNMYLLNPEEVPTRPSWELGKKLAEELIARHQEEHKEFPTKVGFDLRSSATFRDYGVMEGQILTLIGVEPIWDERNLVNDVKLIPREKLGRPRIDVFVAAGGWYESNLPSRLNLWDKAIRLASAADEPDNPIGRNTRQLEEALRAKGIAADRAQLLAPGRIFGIAPGRESSGLRAAVERSGDWNTRDDIATRYLDGHKFVYTEGAWGERAAELYDSAIQGTHTVVRSWSDHMTGPLASKYTWLHGGALCLAVERMTGKRPDYVFSDVRDPDNAGMVRAEDALRKEYRVRLFNRKWLEGMMKEGYAGADNVRVMVSNSFGWETMRPGSVGDDNWLEMKNVLVDDKLGLSIHDWYERNNPHAFQDATAVMLEAIRKGFWKADAKTKQQLAVEYTRSVARHGLSGHVTSGGNGALDEMVRGEIDGLPGAEGKELLAKYVSRINQQRQPSATDAAPGAEPAPAATVGQSTAPVPGASEAEQAGQASPPPTSMTKPAASQTTAPPGAKSAEVKGKRLEPVAGPPNEEAESSDHRIWLWIAAMVIIILLVAGGFILRKGIP